MASPDPEVGSRWREKGRPGRIIEVLEDRTARFYPDTVLIQSMTVANKRKQAFPSRVPLDTFHHRFEFVSRNPVPMSPEEWEAAIERDGGHVLTVEDGVASWGITPAFVGFDHVDMIDYQMVDALRTGRLWPETRDAFLDARAVWSGLEREGNAHGLA